MKRLLPAAGLAATLCLAACGGDTAAESTGTAAARAGSAAEGGSALSVAAAFYPMEFLVREVGGDRVDIVALTPPGAEAHDLELTADSLVALQEADLLVYLETFQPAVDDAVAQRDGDTLDLGPLATREFAEGGEHAEEEGSTHAEEEGSAHAEEEGAEHADEHGGADPHFWTDPTLMTEAAGLVADALTEADPEGGEAYAANLEALTGELEAVDADARERLGECSVTTLVTAHDAFGYFSDRYGFENRPISGLSPEDEPSPAELAEISDLVEQRGVTTVYTETLVPTDLADTVAAETGAATAVLDPVEGLTDESAGDDYLAVMTANIATLADGQGCS